VHQGSPRAELLTFGKTQSRFAIIHRTVRCTSDSVRCSRNEATLNSPALGIRNGYSAIIHRTVRCNGGTTATSAPTVTCRRIKCAPESAEVRHALKGKCALGPFLSILVIECQHKCLNVNLYPWMDKVQIKEKSSQRKVGCVQPKGCSVWSTGLSGGAPDSVRCARLTWREVAALGNSPTAYG
jgi:hypothetical protein